MRCFNILWKKKMYIVFLTCAFYSLQQKRYERYQRESQTDRLKIN